jgi:threo-3-hydroxy-L-aspartate ammonia-lyase
MIGPADIDAAAGRLRGVAVRTPALGSPLLDARVGARVALKAEVLQRTGSFKFRGAFNRVSTLTSEERERGVVAFTSGNHGQAVALACKLQGVAATIVMPADAPTAKLEATRRHGAELITYDRYTEDREAIARGLAAQRGLTLVPPFDHPDVVAGQGTAALELVQDAGQLDLLLAPVSGGGLIAGCAVAAQHAHPGTRVVGVEPAAGDDTRRSLAAGHRVAIETPRSLADALGVSTPGELTFAINQQRLEGVVTVSDGELIEAMRFAFEQLKLVLEPSGGAGLAALLSGRVEVEPGSRVGVILSGGNVDADRFAMLLAARPPA